MLIFGSNSTHISLINNILVQNKTDSRMPGKKKDWFWLILLLMLGQTQAQTHSVIKNDFKSGINEFLLNGKPFVIRAGELHYSRIPRPYWDHRIKMAKAMGMNTVCIYLFWNYHEQQEGIFDFSGQKDVAEFVRLIQANGMYCILRPGPYVCAEWDMGGLPWWLLKKPTYRYVVSQMHTLWSA